MLIVLRTVSNSKFGSKGTNYLRNVFELSGSLSSWVPISYLSQ